MSLASLRFRFRPDLICEQILFGVQPSWVVRDPVSGRLFYFNAREFAILGALDGHRDLNELLDEVRHDRPDEFLSPETLVRFVADARKSGLVISRGAGAPSEAPESGRRNGLQLLAAQIPLFNPRRLLTALAPDLDFAFSRPFLVMAGTVVLSAALSIVVRFEDFTERLPAASAWLTPEMVGVVAVVVFACKMAHELAHGLVATRFGARVEECGVVFLFFMPCFYCDVSDAWLFRHRRRRILVSAAGMLVELGLAGAATWLWWFSRPGPMQTVCLAVMTACSVNTLFINGNPLMRFDGYFILADCLGLPNLSARSAQWWSAFWNRWLWGLPTAAATDENDWRCALYGAFSLVYRLTVVAGLLWFLHRAGVAWGLAPLTLAIAMLTAGGVVVRAAKTVARPLGDSLMRRMMRPGRVVATLTVAACLLAFAALQPFPRSVEADFVLEPQDATPVFAEAPGRLMSLVPAGTSVVRGDVIAVLENLLLERQLAEAETEERLTERRLESAQLRRSRDPDAGRVIPSLTDALAGLRERKQLLQKDVAALTILAPADGSVLPPPNIAARVDHDVHVPRFWSGTPFDPQNRECFLERGTLLGQIAPSGRLSAVAFVGQRDVERLAPGQRVRLMLDGGEAPLAGSVSEISPSPVERIARELVAGKRIAGHTESGHTDVPAEPHYQVRVPLVGGGMEFIPGVSGIARIEVAHASLLRRWMDALQDAFRFEAAPDATSL